MKIKVVLFDCDGVVIFGNPWLQLHKAMNVPPKLDREWYDAYHSGEITYDQWNQKISNHYMRQKLNRKFFEQILDLKNFIINNEAKDLITFIKKQNIQIAFISSGIDYYVSKIAQYFDVPFWHANGIFDFDENNNFTKIRYNDLDPQAKVKDIDEVCKKLEISPKESIFIGDANNDLEAFRYTQRGILYKTTNPNNKENSWGINDDLLQKAAWKKVDNLRDVVGIIKDINGAG